MHHYGLKFIKGETELPNKIEVIGLGAGDIDQLSLGIYKKLTTASSPIWVRTKDHPVVAQLSKEGVQFKSFDHYYEEETTFEKVYERIVEELMIQSKQGSMIYAVPGHPMLAEQTIQLLLDQTEVSVDVIGGQSYLDDLFTALKIDPIEGFQFVDGTSFEREQLSYGQHLIFCQVYDRYVASEVKLALLEDLPADYEVVIALAAGSVKEVITKVPLQELDHHLDIGNLTTVYVPPAPKRLLNHTFSRLRETISTLRGPHGCAWDRKQTHETLRKYLIEETYELIDAIDAEDDEAMIEELGDVLLQVMLHSQIGEDIGYFTINDVIEGITNKMIYRHPHVFEHSTGDPSKSWEELKYAVNQEQSSTILGSIVQSSPSLTKSYQLQKQTAEIGFGWDEADDIWAKLDEELTEVKEAIQMGNIDQIEAELGDVLFVIANLARHYEVNPEIALNRTNQKFMSRFKYVEQKFIENEKDIYHSSLKEMDIYWNEAKRKED